MTKERLRLLLLVSISELKGHIDRVGAKEVSPHGYSYLHLLLKHRESQLAYVEAAIKGLPLPSVSHNFRRFTNDRKNCTR